MNKATRVTKGGIVICSGLVATIYLINPTAGIIEIIPDNMPLIGNLDEAGAAGVLISALRYFGIDVNELIPFLGSAKQDRDLH